jgi:hypothetical protein
MATISGGSKPTFTVDQVLHAVEMNQLNQEWIVDSVPAGSAGKNGDVVFVTSKGGVWAKVSGSWVQASLTSADMQALQDQIDTIQSSGYDDTELRSDFASADAATLTSANDYTDQKVAGITVPDVSDLTTKTYVDAQDLTKLDKGTTTYVDAKAIQDDIDGIETSISDLSDNYDQLVIDLGDAGGDLSVELAGYLKKGTASYADAAGIEADVDQEKTDRAAGDADTLSAANDYTDNAVSNINIDTSDLALQADLDAETQARIDGDAALQSSINAIDVSTKFDKGATTYADAKEMEDAIAAIDTYDDTALAARVTVNEGDITNIKAEQLTQNTDISKNTADIAAIVVPNVDDFVTETELNSALAGKADEPHTHDDLSAGDHNHDGDYSASDHTHPPQDLTHDHSGEYQPVGDYALDSHTHDTTHDHNADYQPVGDYATKTELTTGLADKSDSDHVHIQTGSGLTFDPAREGQVVQSTNGTDWTAGMSLRVVTSVPDDTEGEIGDVVFVVGS